MEVAAVEGESLRAGIIGGRCRGGGGYQTIKARSEAGMEGQKERASALRGRY